MDQTLYSNAKEFVGKIYRGYISGIIVNFFVWLLLTSIVIIVDVFSELRINGFLGELPALLNLRSILTFDR